MLEARLEYASTLKRLLDAIKELVSDANFECNDEGIQLQAMDNSHVALVTVMLKENGFQNYRCDRNMPLGINVASLCKILKCAKDDDMVTLKAGDEADTLSLTFEAIKTERVAEYEMKLMDIDQEHLGIPDTSYDATVSMSSAEFQKICRDLTTLGESVKIEVTKEGVRFSSDGEIGSSTVLLKATTVNKTERRAKSEESEGVVSPKKEKGVKKEKVKKEKGEDDEEEEEEEEEEEDAVVVDDSDEEEEKPKASKRKAPANGKASGSKAKKAKKGDDDEEDVGVSVVLQQSVTSTFSLKYLLNFTKSAPLAKRVTLSMSDEIPMLVGFDFETGFINYYLAPKIGEE